MGLSDELREQRVLEDNVDLLRVRRERDSATKEVARLTEQLASVQRALTFVEHV